MPYEKVGLSEAPKPDFMDRFYSREEQAKYGALGIELRLTDLQRFIDAQDNGYSFGDNYDTALAEIKNGMKVSCWMWYVFPQISGLGFSEICSLFSVRDMKEAIDYIQHPILRARLIEISGELLKLQTNDPMIVFGSPDAFKLRSCMTLFKYADPDEPIFQQVLDKFCMGNDDTRTLRILKI